MRYHTCAALAAAFAFGLLTTGAQAVTYTLLDSSTNNVGNVADGFASDFGAHMPAGATWDKNWRQPVIDTIPYSDVGYWLSPFMHTSLAEERSFFAVGAKTWNGDDQHNQHGAKSPMTLSFASAVDSIDFLWGTIDDYNTLTLYSGATEIDKMTGKEILTELGIPRGKNRNSWQVALMTISGFGPAGLTSMKFESSPAAFEFALRASPAAVPLPASLLLLASGIGSLTGLRFLSRRRGGAAA